MKSMYKKFLLSRTILGVNHISSIANKKKKSRNMKKVTIDNFSIYLLVIFTIILIDNNTFCTASCPNRCQGHGTCGENDVCKCDISSIE